MSYIKIYDDRIFGIYTKDNSVLVVYHADSTIPNPLDNSAFELFCFNSNEYESLTSINKDDFNDYLEEIKDDLYYTSDITITDYNKGYLYCAFVIRKSKLTELNIPFQTEKHRNNIITELQNDVKKYESWMNGDCYIAHLQINEPDNDSDFWIDAYNLEDVFDYFDNTEKDWKKIDNPIISKYLEL